MGIHVVDADGLTWRLRKPMGAEQGDSLFSCENIVLAEFFFVDAIRPDAAREVQLLKKRGLGISILSGDRPEKVQAMAAALDIAPEAAKAAHTPDAKAQWMRECGKHSLFIGDGANDSLAADIALVSGTPAVERSLLAEKADFYFLSRGLRPIRLLFNIARTRAMASRAALVFALLYNASVISISLAGHMNPLLAAVLMPLSSLTSLAIVKIMFSVR